MLSLPLVSQFPLGPSLCHGSRLLRPGGLRSRLLRPGGLWSRLPHMDLALRLLPRFQLRSTALLDCSMSGSCSLGGSVTNPVHELMPTHHIVSCTTLQLHITQLSQSLICSNHTASLRQACFISLRLHLSHCEVLFSPV